MQRILVFLNHGLLRLIALVLILVLVASIIGQGVVRANPGWYDSEWQYRKKITINSANVTGDLSNFPVLISIIDSDLASRARSNGFDILFTEDDEVTKLSHEIESFNATTEKLVAWVKIPSLSSSTDTDIYMYYGYASASDQQDAANVWDHNFALVDHMIDNPDTSHTKDSTSNSITGIKTADGEPAEVTGEIDKAQDFDGNNDKINLGNLGWNHSKGMIEAIIKPDDNGIRKIFAASSGGPTQAMSLHTYNDALYGWFKSGITLISFYNTLIVDGNYHYVVLHQDGATCRMYIDGELQPNTDSGEWFDDISPSYYQYGAIDYPAGIWQQYYDGILDEVRVSDIDRSADWIKTSYNNQSNPSTFLTLWSEETQTSQAPVAIGGLVLPINKATLLAPWLSLGITLSLVIAWIIFRLRKRRSSRHC